jgi:ATP-dependent DNA helicase RecQ
MKALLKKYFGYDDFRPLQAEIIASLVRGQDAFVLMPTGGGKSLCYQLPAVYLPGLTIVISPLIALMKDQVDSLKANGIAAEFINSSLESGQIAKIMASLADGSLKLLYIAPERLAMKEFQDFLGGLKVSLVAIDEAHCISEWGHDFRPDYRGLSGLKKIFPGVPLVALTATATAKVRQDIIGSLNLKEPKVFISSFDRPNLTLRVIEKKQAFHRLVDVLRLHQGESAIIYCFSRKETEEVAANLKRNGFSARAYHAGLEPAERRLAQELFIKDKIDIIVATIAFGMGIDKPNVRLVVHYSFPKTLEGYYQEIGRAGRDGLPSECLLFYTQADTRKHEFFINEMDNRVLAERSRLKLGQVLEYCELVSCRKKHLLHYFGEELAADNCGSCDNCTSVRQKFEASAIAQKIIYAVVRTGGRFGAKHIIDVLLGRRNQKVLINKHDELPDFAAVKDFSEHELGQLIAQLVGSGLLAKSLGKYPVLTITKEGVRFLEKGGDLELAKPEVDRSVSSKRAGGLDYDLALFEELRVLRRQLAEELAVPPFVVFGDVSLREMAYYFPQDSESFARISGVGARKLEQFGQAFTRLIKAFVLEHGGKQREKPAKNLPATAEVVVLNQAKFYDKTRELVQKKVPFLRIAKHQGIEPRTVVNHLEKMLDAGESVDLEYLKLPKDRFESIRQGFVACGDEQLAVVFKYLAGKYSYDELRLARLLLHR